MWTMHRVRTLRYRHVCRHRVAFMLGAFAHLGQTGQTGQIDHDLDHPVPQPAVVRGAGPA